MRSLFTLAALLVPCVALGQQPKDAPDDMDGPVKSGRVNLALDPGKHTAPITRLCFSPDGKQLTTVSFDSSIRIWDIDSGETVKVFYPPGQPNAKSAKFSADGKRLAITSVYTDKDTSAHIVYILAMPEGRIERVLGDNPAGIQSLALSPDGNRVAVASLNPLKQGVRLWDLTQNGPPKTILKGSPAVNLAFSPDGKRLAWTNKSTGEIIDLHSGHVVGKIKGGGITFSPDGKILTTNVPGKVRIHDEKGEIVRTIDGFGVLNRNFSPDSKSLLINWDPGSNHTLATLVDVESGKELHKFYRGDTRMAWGGAYSHDGKFVATAGGAEINYIYIWRTDDGSLVKTIKTVPWIGGGSAYVQPAWTKDGKSVAWYAPGFGNSKSSKFKFGAFDLAEVKLAVTPPAEDRFPVQMRGKKRLEQIASPDPRYGMKVGLGSQTVSIWGDDPNKPLLTLYRKGDDWVIWTEHGYYAATPGGERLMGWTVENGIDQMASFYPAEQFSKLLYRPDVIKLVLEKGSVAEALKAANAALTKIGKAAPPPVTTVEEVLPAKVSIAVDQSNLPEVTIKVSARAAVKGQPIQTLRLMVDGRRLPDGKGVFEFDEGKGKDEFVGAWTVTLPPGRHQIAALALSKDYTPSVSNPVEVSCPASVNERPALHHLSVGVSTYATVRPNLECAHKDALQLADALTDAAKGGLAYRAGTQAKLLDRDATRQKILDQLETIRKVAQPNDLFVFSFAGHGVRDAGEFFLLPHESDQASTKTLNETAISGKILREKLGSFPCQVLLMLDACHAGAVGGLAGGSDEAARSLSDVEVRVAVLGAAHGHERAKEKAGNGLFTAAVIRALRKDPEAFYNRSTGEMSVAHLWAFVYQEVTREANGAQTPYLRLPLGHPAFTITQFPPK